VANPEIASGFCWENRRLTTALVSSDFGLRGERPTNPELLDALAASFMENGWSFKKLHRLVMNSRAWQAAQRTQPLDFESFRDFSNGVALFAMMDWAVRLIQDGVCAITSPEYAVARQQNAAVQWTQPDLTLLGRVLTKLRQLD